MAKYGTIPAAIRRALDYTNICHYCNAMWAAEHEHVIPVAQGGLTVIGNVVKACRRCNAEKSGSTPSQWRTRRLARGRSWPPRNGEDLLPQIAHTLPDQDCPVMEAAIRAHYPPLMSYITKLHDIYYREEPLDVDAEGRELVRLAEEWQAETLGMTSTEA